MRIPLIHIPKNSAVYALGAANKRSKPLFETHDVEWTVDTKDSWALVGKGKNDIFQTLLGHMRVSPPPTNGLYPKFKDTDVFSRCKFVSFRHSGGGNGGFYDYTARYGAMRDGDGKTLRERFREISAQEHNEGPGARELERSLIQRLGLEELLDVPMIALSNGQTRRARIVKAILTKPDILFLDEPLTGLDIESRERLIQLLQSFRATLSDYSPHVLSSYRLQEIVDASHPSLKDVAPSFISHIAYLEGDRFWAGSRDEFFGEFVGAHLQKSPINEPRSPKHSAPGGSSSPSPLVADLQGVNVTYRGHRKVLNDITWQIRQGDRWHLQGSNGSGKTTLLSLITGDHPQSYTQRHLLLPTPTAPPSGIPALPGSATPPSPTLLLHRKRIPTPTLRSSIGIISPELFDAFPRREPSMSVWDAVQTGFTGGFVPANKGVGNVHVDEWDPQPEGLREWRMGRCWEVLEALGPGAWTWDTVEDAPSKMPTTTTTMMRDFARRPFTSLTPGEQRVVLLMRALVGRPPLVILDEVWSGMEERMVSAVKGYFNSGEAFGGDQAVVVVTHWEDEVPWTREQGLKTFRLEKGEGRVVTV